MTATTQTTLDIIREKFDFTVDKFPLSGPDGMKTPKYGLFRSDNAEFVGDTVSGRYVPHTTDDVLAIVEATQEVFDDCHAQCHFRDGHYVNLAPSKDQRRIIFDNGKQADSIFPRLTIQAGFDGRAFSVWLGYFRDLCRNLSMMRSVQSTFVKIRHTSNLRANMDELIAQFHGLQSGWDDLGDVIENMQSAPVRLGAFMDSVYGTPPASDGRALTIHKNRTEKIFKRVLDERARSGRGELDDMYTVSAWEAFNAIQGYTQHDSSRKNKASGFDRIILANNDAAVIKAEKLAVAAIAA